MVVLCDVTSAFVKLGVVSVIDIAVVIDGDCSESVLETGTFAGNFELVEIEL